MKLSVPVAAEGYVDQRGQTVKDSVQCTRIWRNGKMEVIDTQKPFFYVQWNMEEVPDSVMSKLIDPVFEEVQLTRSGEDSPSTWTKVTLPNERALGYLKKTIREAGQRSDRDAEEFLRWVSPMSPNNAQLNTRYIDKILMTEPDFFNQFPQSEHLKVWVFDIEQWSKGEGFEETKKNPLLSNSITVVSGDVEEKHYFESTHEKDADGNIISVDDKEMLRATAKLFKETDPDIVVGFNCNGYDLPVMVNRMKYHGMGVSFFDRLNEKDPFFTSYTKSGKTINKAFLRGRVVYDVKHAVDDDQTLNGQVKNRKLKTILKFYQSKGNIPKDYHIVEEDMIENTHLIGDERLKIYNDSDVTGTKYLFDMYFLNNVAVAEFLGCPLTCVVPMATSYPYTVMSSRVFHEEGLVSIGKNRDRNVKYFPSTGKPYEGAHVECFRTGRYLDVYECDVGSLYPSIMVSLGLGPDNVKIMDTIQFPRKQITETLWEDDVPAFRMEQKGKVRTYYVPDMKRRWSWVIRVTGYSKLATLTSDFLKQRLKLKGLSKSAATAEARYAAYVRAYGLKVVLNSEYGGMGDANNEYGELGAAALITAVGRMVLDSATMWVGPETCIVEDTDGLKTTRNVDINMLNSFTDTFVKDNFNGLPVIKWEKEYFKGIYAHSMKNYVLWNEDDSITLHGVAFKNSRSPEIFDQVIRELSKGMVQHGHDATRKNAMKYFSMAGLDRKDYILSVKLGKPVTEYKGSAIAKNVALSHEATFGVKPRVGVQYEYIKTKRGYEPPTDEAFTRLDHGYYRKIVEKAINTLGYDNIFNKTLFEFL